MTIVTVSETPVIITADATQVVGPMGPSGATSYGAVENVNTAADIVSTTFVAATQGVNVLGYNTVGVGGFRIRRVASQPSHMWRFRSADRLLPNGSTDLTNGGWWEGVSDDYVTPQMFGAKGDNSTNDYTAIQNAINFASSNNLEVWVPNALGYVISPDLTIPGGVVIRGYENLGNSVPKIVSDTLYLEDFAHLATGYAAWLAGGRSNPALITDWAPAFNAAIAKFPRTVNDLAAASYMSWQGGRLVISNSPNTANIAGGNYRFATSLTVDKNIRITGVNSPFLNNYVSGGTTLTFTGANPTGFIIPHMNRVNVPYNYGGDGTVIENLSIWGSDWLIGAPNNHTAGNGILAYGIVEVRNCVLSYWGESGIKIYGDHLSAGSGFSMNNGWTLYRVESSSNGTAGKGLIVDGPGVSGGFDANVGVVKECRFVGNPGGGVYDNSVYGTTYENCLFMSNGPVSIKQGPQGNNSPLVFVGCYHEQPNIGEYPLDCINAICIGGMLSVFGSDPNYNKATDKTTFISNDGSGLLQLSNYRVGHTSFQSGLGDFASFERYPYPLLTPPTYPITARHVIENVYDQANNETGGARTALQTILEPYTSGFTYKLNLNSLSGQGAFSVIQPTATVANGFPRDIGVAYPFSDKNGGILAASNGVMLGGNWKFHGTGTAAPVSGTWVVGDCIWNETPANAAGAQVIGLICTAAGTPGTWRSMSVTFS